MSDGWVMVLMSEGLFRDAWAEPAVQLVVIDLDAVVDAMDYEDAREEYEGLLDRLRSLPPSPGRKAVRSELRNEWALWTADPTTRYPLPTSERRG